MRKMHIRVPSHSKIPLKIKKEKVLGLMVNPSVIISYTVSVIGIPSVNLIIIAFTDNGNV